MYKGTSMTTLYILRYTRKIGRVLLSNGLSWSSTQSFHLIEHLAELFYAQICTGQKPFSERRIISAIIFQIVKGERPTFPPLLEIRPRVKEMVTACWDADPVNRPTAAEVKQLLLEEFPAPQKIKWNSRLSVSCFLVRTFHLVLTTCGWSSLGTI